MTEVAVFIDDNQFSTPGGSLMKCGPEIVSLFWHAVQPGQKNPYSAVEVHAMAHSDYERFIGPDVISDGSGTENQTLYKMLESHGFSYEIGPLNLEYVFQQLKAGYPVILGGIAESSVLDLDLGRNPYNWNTTGLFHIILASGFTNVAGELLVRDTANIGSQGIVRSGPRRYDAPKLSFTTATKVIPSWNVVKPIDHKAEAEKAVGDLQAALEYWGK